MATRWATLHSVAFRRMATRWATLQGATKRPNYVYSQVEVATRATMVVMMHVFGRGFEVWKSVRLVSEEPELGYTFAARLYLGWSNSLSPFSANFRSFEWKD